MSKPERAGSPDRLVYAAVNDLFSLMGDYSVEQSVQRDAVVHIVNALRNVMSVSDTTRLLDEIRSRDIKVQA